mgnify:CR=1 FL=1
MISRNKNYVKVVSLAATLLLSLLAVSPVKADDTPDRFDLLVAVVDLPSNRDPRAVILVDYDTGNPNKNRAWMVNDQLNSSFDPRKTDTVNLRVLAQVDGERSGRLRKGGFYRITGTVVSESRCLEGNGCKVFRVLAADSATKLGTGGCSRKDVRVGTFTWSYASASLYVCSVDGKVYVNTHRYAGKPYAPALVVFVNLEVRPKSGSRQVLPQDQSVQYDLANGPVQLPVTVPGNARCSVKLAAVMDIKDDGQPARRSKEASFSLPC